MKKPGVHAIAATEPKHRVVHEGDRSTMPPPSLPVKRTVKAKGAKPKTKDDLEFDELLDKLRCRKDEQVDPENSVCEWERSNSDDRKFLASLDEDAVPLKLCHEDALVYRKGRFNSIKDDLVKKLFDLFHETVFQSRFNSEIPITWNVRMLKTAGCCYYRRHQDGSKRARIELSPKVLDRPSRLRDTLLHEMCHAAGWLIHGYRDGHGTLFKFWAQRALQLLGLTVTTTHSYIIETKYVYRCQGCANEVRRHSKSLDTSRFICSICKGRFELFVNNKRNNQVTPAAERKPSPFSRFVKDEYKSIKTGSPHLKHSEVMSALSERWRTAKNNCV
ncbi:acidic repeat-containing protein [Galendromus occidentalis]|uniref:Acidic repeat-containing protein n=1 Tax=Galendromus occidentalis TaxID=34638 RepID=A0AAJ6VZ23_9ACAR|nr:acidic repeat-containing protein [Galendromus occidentalis]